MNAFTNDQWVAEIKRALADTESLLSATADQDGEAMAGLRSQVAASLRLAKRRLASVQNAMLERTLEAARTTDAYVHENPWNAIGAAAGVGLLIGFLLSRR